MLEYVPIQSLSFLERWLRSDGSTTAWQADLLQRLELINEMPSMADFVQYVRESCFAINMPLAFANSQVRLLQSD
jgi:hypothetical protein